MSDWKYIMWEANGAKIPVIFPNALIHSDVADGMSRVIRQHVIAEGRNDWSSKVLSAGFVSGMIVTGVHGESESMGGMKSIEDDRAVINTWPYTQGREDLLGVEATVIEAVRRNLK